MKNNKINEVVPETNEIKKNIWRKLFLKRQT